MKMNVKMLVKICVFCVIFFLGTQLPAFAYNLMSGYVKFPVNSYYLTYSYSQKGSKNWYSVVSSGVLAWNSSPATIYITNTSSGGNLSFNSNAYGSTGWDGYTDLANGTTDYRIATIKLNDSYSAAYSNGPELVAHEAGHALGVAHNQDNTSVMRQYGYKGSPTPNSDDVNGVNYWY